ncbi:phosphoric diester hydrolase LALA0_S07e04874g [Lachancea lanzarotensis]|uniref:LALA0S07e04874g1_1 n=1 Tax=Lachancea lanzarotensis TaxID=1245769 RepID=A0A0C7MZI6_9SACH|nr:uncharacterized protein LALA0_S07e04874g [Lachancea lanzarotensis]CEP63207.1 LALA0S07e04874g1_1 [Lachancea lanzarotensis]
MELLEDQYPSDNESEEEVTTYTRIDLPALPSALLDKFHVSPNIEKFTQQQPHRPQMNHLFTRVPATTQGVKWTSFAFIEMRPTLQQRQILDKVTCQIAGQMQRHGLSFQPLHMSDLGSPLPLHVSLSGNLEFGSAAEVDAFEHMLRIEVLQQMAGPFQVDFEPSLKVYENVGRNALFLALGVKSEQKNGVLRQLWQAVHESFDFCRRNDPAGDNSVSTHESDISSRSQQSSGHERSHVSIARAFSFQGPVFDPNASTSVRQIDELNRVLEATPIDPTLLQALTFECTGIKITKQRSNVWIGFPENT